MKLLNHELKLSISLDEKTCVNAKAFSAAGYEAAECDLPVDYFAPVDLSIFPPFLEKVCPAIEEAGLRITTFHLPFGTFWDISSPDEAVRTAAVAASAELLKMLAPYAGENIVVHPSFEPIAEEAREAHIAACRKSLAELGPVAAKCGKKIALENLPRTCLGRTSEEMVRLTDGGALCGVCMDTTHMFHETPQQYMQRCGKWIINTHLSDYLNGQNECHWVPGTGSLNWKEILQNLIDLGYAGTYNFEVSKYAPLEILGGLKNAIGEHV